MQRHNAQVDLLPLKGNTGQLIEVQLTGEGQRDAAWSVYLSARSHGDRGVDTARWQSEHQDGGDIQESTEAALGSA